MDFETLLHVAKKNENVKKEVNYYSTKFEPPKKEKRDKSQLSINIQKFLAKKEEEERQKKLEFERKRDEMLAKRDPKLKKKILKHLKVVKSANKSVLEDAKGDDNMDMTQPVNDDYGFVSEEASALHEKFMQKYFSKPEEKKFPDGHNRVNNDLTGIKERVRAAIEREKEEALLPRKRHRRTKAELMASQNGGSADYSDLNFGQSVSNNYKGSEREEEVKPKPKKKPMPPPMDYTQLLKMAEKLKDEPVQPEPKVEKKEPERLMTNKQKREHEEMQRIIQGRKQREIERLQAMKNKSRNGSQKKVSEEQKVKAPTNNPPGRIPKVNGYKPSEKPISSKPTIKESQSSSKSNVAKNMSQKSQAVEARTQVKSTVDNSARKMSNGVSNGSKMQSKPRPLDKPLSKPQELPNKERPRTEAMVKDPKRPINGEMKQKMISKGNVPPNSAQKPRPSEKAPSRQFPPADTKAPRQFPPADTKPRQFPPNDIKGSRQFPPSDTKSSRQFPPKDVRPGMSSKKKIVPNKRRILDDDSEYDSELDDFIDDGPEDGNDYSKYIKDIFGYDKSRYRDEDEDDLNMESNFAQVMREEYISKKIGIMEDLEDMKMEAMEKKMKAAKKKRLK